MRTFILLFQCRDQKGIVARISDFIFRHGGNIITADQFSTDPQDGYFFMRIEFFIKDCPFDRISLEKELSPIAKHFKAEYKVCDKEDTLRMGILVSKPDHCLAELLYLWKSKELRVQIPFVISNHREHEALVKQHKIPFHFIPADKENLKEPEILALALKNSDFLVLARYMLILSESFLKKYNKDVINIHHSFLPSFKGANPYRQAFRGGVKVIGATAHFVNEKLDEGAIIAQMVEPVSHKDDVFALMRQGKNLEKRALARAILDYIDYRIFKHNNKTVIF